MDLFRLLIQAIRWVPWWIMSPGCQRNLKATRRSGFSQSFKQYGTDETYKGKQLSASLGNRNNNLSWWFAFNRLDSDGQPIAFANKLVNSGTVSGAGTPVTGCHRYRNPQNQDWLILGSTSQTN
jgi:iron complex outermembrane receptor protein